MKLLIMLLFYIPNFTVNILFMATIDFKISQIDLRLRLYTFSEAIFEPVYPGGIFKETDVGKWVHLVCALYIPGIAFGDPDRLSNVTLFEISSSKWGSKACQLCQDTRFVRTGMTIECDAGMCRNYFHVTW